MSHRVTTNTEMKDKELAIAALRQANCTFTEQGSQIQITGGPLKGASLNLTTGQVQGDTDFGHKNNNDSLGFLKRFYAEAKVKQECAIQGITIEERTVDKNGVIQLLCQGHFA